MTKENLIKVFTKAYDYLKGRGWSETLIKVVLGALFGIICALCFSSCSISYKTDDINFTSGFMVPVVSSDK